MQIRYYTLSLHRSSDDALIGTVKIRIPQVTRSEWSSIQVGTNTPIMTAGVVNDYYNQIQLIGGASEASLIVCAENLTSQGIDAWNYYSQFFPEFKWVNYLKIDAMYVPDTGKDGMSCYFEDADGNKFNCGLNYSSTSGYTLDTGAGLTSDAYYLNAAPINTSGAGYYRGTIPFYITEDSGQFYRIGKIDIRADRAAVPTTNSRLLATKSDGAYRHQFGPWNALYGASAIIWENPYSPEEESGPGGGDGDYDDESDENPMSSVPTTSFADAGFCRIYSPTLSEVKDLSRYMWTDTTFLQTVINHLKQLIENPMDAIISFSMVPLDLSSIRQSPVEVNVMYVPTGVYMSPVSRQFIDVDCGELKISKNIGCALDYNPYTKIHAYLPYIGQVTLDTDEVMGKTLRLRYRIDIVTGICAAYILVDGAVMYNYSGHCSISQPLSSADFSGYINAMISAAKMVAGVAAGAGGAPGVAAGLIGGPTSRTTRTQQQALDVQTTRNPKTGRQITSGTDTYKMDKTTTTEGASFGELASRSASNTVASVMNSKLVVEHTSGFSGNSGYLAQREPFVIIERPRLCNPREYGKFNGFPSMMYLNLGNCTGYTEVQQIQLTGFNATNPELSEISELLKSGVIL